MHKAVSWAARITSNMIIATVLASSVSIPEHWIKADTKIKQYIILSYLNMGPFVKMLQITKFRSSKTITANIVTQSTAIGLLSYFCIISAQN